MRLSIARGGGIAAMVLWGLAPAGAASADVLVLRAGEGERPLTCVILEETETAYVVRVKFGKSTIPKTRVVRAERHPADANAALIVAWDAATGKAKTVTPKPGLVEGPIPPATETEKRTIHVRALLDEYGLDAMQAGFEVQAFCPPNGPYCELLVRGVAAFQDQVLGLQKDDRLLGIDGERFPNGPAADPYFQRTMSTVLTGGTQVLHLIRGTVRVDITYGP